MRKKRMSAIFAWLLMFAGLAQGKYLDPTVETNVNKVDPLFERSIEDYEGFKRDLAGFKAEAAASIKNNQDGSNVVKQADMREERARLENIGEAELEILGRSEMSKDPFYDEMFADMGQEEDSKEQADIRQSESLGLKKRLNEAREKREKYGQWGLWHYITQLKQREEKIRNEMKVIKDRAAAVEVRGFRKPGMQAHYEDAKLIANASGKMIDNLVGHLKDLGVDCKTVKGDIEKEPEYFMEFDKAADRDKGDTIYDQYFCERVRKIYNCSDELALKCLNEGREWLQWQDREIDIAGEEICREHHHLLSQGSLYKKDRRGRHTKKYYHMNMRQDIATQYQVRAQIANKIGAELEQVNENIGINPIGSGGLSECQRYEVKWDSYHFKYQYRDWKKICTSWSEVWHEHCRLKD